MLNFNLSCISNKKRILRNKYRQSEFLMIHFICFINNLLLNYSLNHLYNK